MWRCTRCGGGCSKRRRTRRACRCERCRCPGPAPTSSTKNACARPSHRRSREGFTHVAFGDLFLEDVRKYREEKLAGTGLTPLFPIWGIPTDELAARMVESGLRSVLTCVNPKQLDRSFAGRQFDRALLDDLPAGVDKCGERGEFHSFAWDGPMFNQPVAIRSARSSTAMGSSLPTYPERIVCLTEETTETLYLLGEGHRVVGISGYTLRPPEARTQAKGLVVHFRALRKNRGARAGSHPDVLRSAGRHRVGARQTRAAGLRVQPAFRRRHPSDDSRARGHRRLRGEGTGAGRRARARARRDSRCGERGFPRGRGCSSRNGTSR